MPKKKKENHALQLIVLGGTGEIGKNMFAIKYQEEIIVLDAGLKFPEEGMLGIDIVIPDISFLLEHRSQVKAIILTHGHEDHIGALPFIISELPVPVYGTRLTLGLVEAKLMEYNLHQQVDLREITADDSIAISGSFNLEFFRTNHSIPDSVGIAMNTPVGTIVYTSDFKFDQTPVDGRVTDFHRLAALGRRGVLAALVDSTNADRPGYTASEKQVGATIDDIFRLAEGRIIFATFATNIHRIQQVIAAARRYGRKICIIGRSIINSVEIASKLGYLDLPAEMIVEVDQIQKFPFKELVLLTTGSQGEPMSALTRISQSEHRVSIIPGDTVIIAASPIPGNEKLVSRTVDNLFRRGAEVIYQSVSGIHVSGHGSAEEIKLMLNLLRPSYLVPVHGEYRHQVHCAKIAASLGIPKENIFLTEPGTIMEFSEDQGCISGSLTMSDVLVDGLGVGDVGNVVLRDRRILAEEGIVVIVVVIDGMTGEILEGPELVTRGFVYVREAEELLIEAREIITSRLQSLAREKLLDWNVAKANLREAAGQFFFEKTGRRPMILPIIMEHPPSGRGEETELSR